MSAMLSVTQLEPEPEPEVFHEYLKPTPEMKWPLLSIWVGADVCLNHESYSPTGVFKITGGPYGFEGFTKGNDKSLELIYAPSSNHIKSLPPASARQKVPSAIPVFYLSKAEKNLAVAVLLDDGRERASQKVVSGCSGRNEDPISFTSRLGEK